MGKKHPRYADEFRQRMVELVKAGRTPAELAKEFDCNAQSIRNWVGDAATAKVTGTKQDQTALDTAERAELARLRKDVKRLKTERDILAKATAWFANSDEKTSTGSSNS